MTPRQRFHATMRHGRADRVPLLEEGLREDVLEQWRRQGLPPDADLARLFAYDRRERLEINLDPLPVPADGPVDPVRLRAVLNADDPARLPADWEARVRGWSRRDHILELPLHRGLFRSLGVNGWAELESVLYLLADDPARVRAVMDVQAQFAAKLAERILRQVEVDFVSFSEPIADSHGPLVSPAAYRQAVLDSYRPVLDVLHRHGVDTIVFTTYGNTRALLPDVLAAGFNTVWAIETETAAMDYGELRRQFGPALRLIGGIDLDCLTRGAAAIEHEVRSKAPPLLAQGGYIPLADGRVRANIPFAHYTHYRRVLESVAGHL
jgi:hypothetical protein